MKFRLYPTSGIWVAFMAIVALASCKKDASSNGSNESSAATFSDSSTAADNMYYDVLNNAFVGFSDNSSVWNSGTPHSGQTTTYSTSSVNTAHLGCAIYTLDDTVPGEYPKTLTLDFGTGCTSADGVLRKGKLVYLFTGSLLDAGSTASVTFNQYSVNGYALEGTYAITNNSSPQIGLSFTTKVTNGMITYPSGKAYNYSHNKTYIMTAGLATPLDITDDVYSITGNSAISNTAGASIVFNTTTPLVKAVSCHNISAGAVSFVYNNAIDGSIDFGSGSCDNLATLTIGNSSSTIILR
jgi:hypothetical protein